MLTLTWSEDVGGVVRETASLTTRPFCGNLVLTEDRHRRLDQALEAGLRIVSFFLGDPGGYTGQVHDAGGIVMHTVGSAEEARRAVASGVDVVVAQGWEAGGHLGSTVATLDRADVGVLVERVADAQRRHAPLQLVDDRLVDRLLHEEPRAGAADVALVEVDAVDDPLDRLVERGVVEDDVRRLAAELERQLLARAGEPALDRLADLGRAGERDLVDARRRRARRPCGRRR